MLWAKYTSIAALALVAATGQVKGQGSAQEEEVRQLQAALADLDQRLAAVGQRTASGGEDKLPESTPVIRQAKAQLEDAKLKYESAARLAKTGDISQERYIELEKAYRARQAAHESALDEQRTQLASIHRGIAEAAQNARQSVRWLNAQVAGWKPSKPGAGQALAKGIRQYREALEALPADLATTQAVLQALAEDAMLKSEHCRAAGLAATVKAQIRTLRQQQEVLGWEVYYLPRFLALSRTAKADRFPRVSSPTTEDLAPGNYVLWAVDPQTKSKAEPVAARVGGEGNREVVIDLPVQ